MMFSDGSQYNGQFIDDSKQGHGTETRPDGVVPAPWVYCVAVCTADHQMTRHTFSGTKYTGEWLNGRRHGRGELVFPSGARYSMNHMPTHEIARAHDLT